MASLALVTALVATTFTASASIGARPHIKTRHGGLGGAVRLHGSRARTTVFKKQPNLRYHGGPVMPASTTRVIYWTPAGRELDAPTYTDIIDRYFTDTAADSGGVDNVYSVLNQYTDADGNRANYTQTFAGSFVDTHPYPANGCPNTVLPPASASGSASPTSNSGVRSSGWSRRTSGRRGSIRRTSW